MSKESSSLRTGLDRAKGAHESVRYPGDLAAELLPVGAIQLKPAAQPLTTNRWFWAFGTSSAVAASLVTAFILTSRTPEVQTGVPVAGQPVRSGMSGSYAAYTPMPVFEELSGRGNGVAPSQFEMVPQPVDPAGNWGRLARNPAGQYGNRPSVGFANSPEGPFSVPSIQNFNLGGQPTFRPGTYTQP